jgi:hypothetical protein
VQSTHSYLPLILCSCKWRDEIVTVVKEVTADLGSCSNYSRSFTFADACDIREKKKLCKYNVRFFGVKLGTLATV